MSRRPAAPRVVGLRRYPVKSMLGEETDHLDVDARGVTGDRLWSVRTPAGKIGSGKNSRRFAAVIGLLGCRAREVDGRVLVTLPDGSSGFADDDATAELVSRHVGKPVTLARETTVSHFDDGPVSLIGQASIDAVAKERGEPVDPARFRANVLLDTTDQFVEETWVGRRLRIGTALLEVMLASPRCVMVDMATADLPQQHGILTTVGRLNGARLGVVAAVLEPGRVSLGDVVALE